jgi:hypothetical protein
MDQPRTIGQHLRNTFPHTPQIIFANCREGLAPGRITADLEGVEAEGGFGGAVANEAVFTEEVRGASRQ